MKQRKHAVAFLFSELANGPGQGKRTLLGVGIHRLRAGTTVKIAVLVTMPIEGALLRSLDLYVGSPDDVKRRRVHAAKLTDGEMFASGQQWFFFEWSSKLHPGPYQLYVDVNGSCLYEMRLDILPTRARKQA